MALDVYRGCTRAEKRQVLEVFWRRGVEGTERLRLAASQYGPWAVVSCAVVALELIPILVVSVEHAAPLAWLAATAEAVAVWSTWWASVRALALRRVTAP